MRQIISNNKLYFVLFTIWSLFISALLVKTEKIDLHLSINNYHHPLLDSFFEYFTYLGGSILFALSMFYLIIKKDYKTLVPLTLGYLLSILLVQFGKHFLIENNYRPSKVFEDANIGLRLIEGVKMKRFNSFPSGHTTDGFAVCTFLAVYFKKRSTDITFFVTAALVGISRVYLSQHFTEDIFAGSILGVISMFTVMAFYSRKEKKSTQLV